MHCVVFVSACFLQELYNFKLYSVYSMLLHVSGPCSVRARTKLEIICLDARPSSENGPPIGRGWTRGLNTGLWLATWYRATVSWILASYWFVVSDTGSLLAQSSASNHEMDADSDG